MNKRTLLIVGAVGVLAIAIFFGFKTYSEATLRGNIETVLANLPDPLKAKAEKIEVSLSGKSVSLINLKGTYTLTVKQPGTEEIVPMDFTIERIDANGVNMDGFKPGAGMARLFDSLAFRNMAFDSPTAKANIELYRFEDISCDAESFGRELAKALPSLMAANASASFPGSEAETKKLFADLGSLMRAYETIHIGRITCEKYIYALDFEGQKFDLNLGIAEIKDYSIRKMGPFTVDKLNMTFNGSPLMTLERLSADGVVLPSFAPFFDIAAAADSPSPEMVRNAFKGQAFSVQNLCLKDLTMLHPEKKAKNLFSLADLDFSYTAETDHAMDLVFNSLNIQKSLLIDELRLPSAAFASLPETISVEGGWQQTITPKDTGSFDLDCKKFSLKGSGLGETTVSVAADNVNTMALMIMGSPGDASLKNLDFAVRDGGLSDAVFALNGLLEGKTAAEARADEVASLRQESEKESSPSGKELLNGLIGFLEKPGSSLRVVLAPAEPINMNRFAASFLFAEPAAIGLSVSVEQDN